jgi:APA family basic amino acid/polyamine antiporter
VYRRRDLIIVGLGVMIGAGIFKISGVEAATSAGPAVIVSFLIAGAICLLSALSYAELSSTMPVAGSAYSFTYVIFGELWAWVIGWAMLLEMGLAVAVISRAWSLVAVATLGDFGATIPGWLAPYVGQPKGFDVFALLILVALVAVVAVGARLGVRILWMMVVAKLVVILLVIGIGLTHIHTSNYKPFVPHAQHSVVGSGGRTLLDVFAGTAPHAFGLAGIFTATAAIAFAYLGFDVIATAAEETADARRDVPRGMLGSLLIAIVLYVGVAIVLIGMRPYTNLNSSTPLASAFHAVGAGGAAKVINLGALLGLTTVILVLLVGQTRVVFSMARDGLLPKGLAAVSGRFRTPTTATIIIGVAAAVLAETVDIFTLQEMVVIGTLFAFAFVSAGVIMLRRTRPDLSRGFRVPLAPLVPVVAIGATLWLSLNLQVQTWEYFGIWMAVGLVLYVGYGRRRSRLGEHLAEEERVQLRRDSQVRRPAEARRTQAEAVGAGRSPAPGGYRTASEYTEPAPDLPPLVNGVFGGPDDPRVARRGGQRAPERESAPQRPPAAGPRPSAAESPSQPGAEPAAPTQPEDQAYRPASGPRRSGVNPTEPLVPARPAPRRQGIWAEPPSGEGTGGPSEDDPFAEWAGRRAAGFEPQPYRKLGSQGAPRAETPDPQRSPQAAEQSGRPKEPGQPAKGNRRGANRKGQPEPDERD